jgi:hypothetical protein
MVALRSAVAAIALAFAGLAVVPAEAQAPVPREPTKACQAAQAKLTRERHSVDAAKTQLAKDAKARESCSTKTACARYDNAIATLTKRVTRHDARVRKFEVAQERACTAK